MSRQKSFTSKNIPLTPPIFYILLVLAVKELHGYEIMKQVSKESDEKIRLGPGTLYSAIKRLLESSLIEETENKLDSNDERRKYYKLTDKGREILSTELKRLSDAIGIAQKYNLLSDSDFLSYGY